VSSTDIVVNHEIIGEIRCWRVAFGVGARKGRANGNRFMND
jgi:hypothetical protein